MATHRSAAEAQVAELLATARRSLGLTAAFLARMDGPDQILEVVDSSVPFLFSEGSVQRRETSLCQAILDGKVPEVVPDLRDHPEGMRLPAARFPRVRSYVSVPVRLSDGSLYGTLCAAGLRPEKSLGRRDKALMDVLARAAAVVIEPDVVESARRGEIEDRLARLLSAGGPAVVLQPIVELGSGARVGAEALSRFPADWGKAPDLCFADAHSVGQGHDLEVIALRGAAEHLTRVTGYVTMNVSPATLLTDACRSLLAGLPLGRVVLELSEHDQVEDYSALLSALAPLRAAGMRLAIDDVGAGFSSLRHIVLTAPDVLKLDRSIVDGVAADPVLRTLVKSMVDFGHGCDARIVAEGVETAADAAALLELGVDCGQGWFFGRPGPPEVLDDAVTAVAATGTAGLSDVAGAALS
ncbi:MAG TPA: EAL domain-containing protein [Actinomycetales bacterium]|nr:EAL domain-containing protein [Actinomycetales bacterium]